MPARKKATTKARTAKTTTRSTTTKSRSAAVSKSTSSAKAKTTTRAKTTAKAKVNTKAKVTAKAKTTAKAKSVNSTNTTTRVAANKLAALSNKAITEKMTKSQVYKEIAETTGLGKNDVQNVLIALKNIVERSVKPRAVGKFKIPELEIQVSLKQKKATKARTGRNPFTGEEIQIAAKPARKVIKVTALKALKELVS